VHTTRWAGAYLVYPRGFITVENRESVGKAHVTLLRFSGPSDRGEHFFFSTELIFLIYSHVLMISEYMLR
jgi:hypothetical protein